MLKHKSFLYIILYIFIIFFFIQNCFSQESWTPTSLVNAPTGRTEHIAIWTGSKMIVWGGYITSNTGGIFDPNSNTWMQHLL